MKRTLIVIRNILIWITVTLAILIGAFLIMVFMIERGPSKRIRDLFVASVKETSAGGFLGDLFLSKETVATIVAPKDEIYSEKETTDSNLVVISPTKDEEIKNDIEVVDIQGPLYHGKMLIVKNPSRVKVGVCDSFSPTQRGMTVKELYNKYDAIAAINGGKYNDVNGFGNGGQPEGIVISQGKLLHGDLDTIYNVYGFDSKDVFVCGSMTAREALARGIRDAVTFGPSLIVNKKVTAYASGLNPRTAIGQRDDGTVLLLVIEGRQTSSLGASYEDLAEIMLEYGAVNAANLDGGMSSTMIYDGEEIINNCSVKGDRDMPTVFYVEKVGK